jgi:hypothetical protein
MSLGSRARARHPEPRRPPSPGVLETPEPGTLALAGTGLACLGLVPSQPCPCCQPLNCLFPFQAVRGRVSGWLAVRRNPQSFENGRASPRRERIGLQGVCGGFFLVLSVRAKAFAAASSAGGPDATRGLNTGQIRTVASSLAVATARPPGANATAVTSP